ncbi:MauE/DoxX family redox-associated membrane protein [Microbacterium sp. Bi128]|uniref:MauE/DoxX family redox-associated membrane protein n=1 Tax=Microbacterium sp. Bi128 TaxID=2821115 RepID=UPI001D4B9EC8|nr:MauE/DoxX family redox-associated membrane protein [Microbacterium sp. Bi128]CAH0164429.1 hypothetical protein SRABI128_00872 [Microbacterium sp. Bi128]
MTWTTVQLVATIIVGASFLVSGILKLRETDSTRATLSALRLPSFLQRGWIARSYPVAEIVLGAALLAVPAPLWWAVAVAALVLMSVLTLLVVRVVRSGEDVACNCFGSTQRISGRTVLRNVVLTVLTVLMVVSEPFTASPVAEALRTRPDVLFAVALAVVTSAAVTVVITMGPPRPRDVDTYEDRPLVVPDVTVRDGSGSPVPLPALTAESAVLLIHVKSGCSPCATVIEAFSDGALIGERVRVRLLERAPADGAPLVPGRLWDDGGEAARVLAMASTPSALLLAADGTIPADPVRGSEAIFELVQAIEEAVAALRPRGLGDVDL